MRSNFGTTNELLNADDGVCWKTINSSTVFKIRFYGQLASEKLTHVEKNIFELWLATVHTGSTICPECSFELPSHRVSLGGCLRPRFTDPREFKHHYQQLRLGISISSSPLWSDWTEWLQFVVECIPTDFGLKSPMEWRASLSFFPSIENVRLVRFIPVSLIESSLMSNQQRTVATWSLFRAVIPDRDDFIIDECL